LSLDTFYVGRLKGVGAVWQLTALDVASQWCRIAVVQVVVGDKTAPSRPGSHGVALPKSTLGHAASSTRTRHL